MPNKMERFTQPARRVLSFAQEEAVRLQHSTIGAEHMLFGLMREEDGVAARVLRDLGLDLRRVQELVAQTNSAEKHVSGEHLDLAPDVKKMLELAVDERRRLHNDHVGTQHLLLGLLQQNPGMFEQLNLTPDAVRAKVEEVLKDQPPTTNEQKDEPEKPSQ